VGAGMLEAQYENFQNPKGMFMLAGSISFKKEPLDGFR
jgi:hypothetical protein